MESAAVPTPGASPLEAALLGAAAREAAHAVESRDEPALAIDAAVGTLHDAVTAVLPSVFMLEHGRLWLVAQRGYAVVPDGIDVNRGVMGRAVRLDRPELVPDVDVDADYVPGLPGVGSQLAVPLRSGDVIVGVLNVECQRPLPEGALNALRPLVSALVPKVEAVRASRNLDLSALARLFVYLGSLRDPDDIAVLAAASLARVLDIDASQLWTWSEVGPPVELASWRSDGSDRAPLSVSDLERARRQVDSTVVSQVLANGTPRGRAKRAGAIVWLPLRANAEELGVLVGMLSATEKVDPVKLDTAAVLAAHAAASLDAALALRSERRSAVTDSLTGILNRRGLEQRLERELSTAQERRVPLSVLVFDCDDFKEINDRAGHEFGDALLREIADVLSRSLPDGAECARLGGDEFVVVLPGAGAEVAEEHGRRIRGELAEGLTDAGFPLRMSGGIATYPFDGAGGTALLRAADQALYAAKDAGKDHVASFKQVVHPDHLTPTSTHGIEEGGRRRMRTGGAILADAIAAAKSIETETTTETVLNRLCKTLVFVVGSTACLASRVDGEFLVDATEHALREVWLGDEAAYRISDFPLTEETLRTGEPRAVSFLDVEVDPAEAFILRELSMNAMLMLPLRVKGVAWGLVELYEMRMRRFSEDDVSIAEFLVGQAERRLEVVASTTTLRAFPPVYELPPDASRDDPRTR